MNVFGMHAIRCFFVLFSPLPAASALAGAIQTFCTDLLHKNARNGMKDISIGPIVLCLACCALVVVVTC